MAQPFIVQAMEALAQYLAENADALGLAPDRIRRSYTPNVDVESLTVGEALVIVYFSDAEKDPEEEDLTAGAFWKLSADVIHAEKLCSLDVSQVDACVTLHEKLADLFDAFESLTLADGRTAHVKTVTNSEAVNQDALEAAELALGSFQLEFQIFNPF